MSIKTDLILSHAQVSAGEWKRVVMHKKDHNGNVKLEAPGKRREYAYLMHVPSGDFYLDEGRSIVAGKSFLVFLATPLYAAASVAWYLGRIVYDTAAIALRTLKQFGENVLSKCAVIGPALNAVRDFASGFMAQVIQKDLWKIVRLPIFAVGMQLTALCGILSPYEGRRWEAMVEYSLQDRASYKQDYRQKVPDYQPGLFSELKACFQGIRDSEACYLAYCFQVRGNYNEARFNFARELPSP